MDVQKVKRKYTRKKIQGTSNSSRKRDFSKYEKKELLKICESLQSPIKQPTNSPSIAKSPSIDNSPSIAKSPSKGPEVFVITKKKRTKGTKLTKKKDIKVKQLITSMSPEEIQLAEQRIFEFKTNGISVLEKLSQAELDQMIYQANIVYYNSKNSLMTDIEYDIVKEYIMNTFPNDVVITQIGAPVEKNKVKLPYEMWSMDKIKPDTNALKVWTKTYKGPYVFSCKLDGVSGLYTTQGETPKLYTRGDGKVGQDISHLLPILKLPEIPGIAVRGEFIIPKKVFDSKYAKTFANPRNLVSGIINAKTIDSKTNDFDFVTYECIDPSLTPSQQLKKLADIGFKVVDYSLSKEVTNDILSDYLVDNRKNYAYEIDGIIVADDNVYPRTSGNPDHAFAFKMVLSDQKAEATVVDVLWEPSKDGYLKPRVRFSPVRLSGVTITYATGYNGKFIEDNKIGIGAIVELVRSGDVIPKILKVVVPAEQTKMPTETYVWNDTHVDIMLTDINENDTVKEKNIVLFFTEIEVDGLKSGNIKKIIKAGFDTIPKILSMTQQDFEEVGYKTLANKYVTNIKTKLDDASVLTLMIASGKMGRGIGSKKISPILETYPDILTATETNESKITKIKTIDGIEQKTAKMFVENIPEFIKFLKDIGQESKLDGLPVVKNKIVSSQHPLNDKKIVMTKTRDKEIIDSLIKFGASLEDTIKKDTFVLIVKSKDDTSNKTKYAIANNIPIMTPDEFKENYLV
jgi:DNA ligase (NAD+)